MKCSDAPESRITPAVILARDGGYCSGRMNITCVCVGRGRGRGRVCVCVCVRVCVR